MKTHSTDNGVVLHALQSLVVLSSPQYPELYRPLVDADVNGIVMSTLKDSFIDDMSICIEACRLLTNLATRAESRVQLGLDEACAVVTSMMKRHETSSQDVVLEATLTCCQLATACSENVQFLTDGGVCESLVTSLDHHRGSDEITEAICRCLVLLSVCQAAKDILSDFDKCQLFVKHLSKMKGSYTAILWMFRLIISMCHDHSSCIRFGAGGAHRVITSTILQYKDYGEAVRYGLVALLRLSEVNGAKCDENLFRLYTNETYEALSLALKLYSHDIDVADPALRLLALITTASDPAAEGTVEAAADGTDATSPALPMTASPPKPSR
ncbi:unnamed protein product, partial [Symbiodinium microadriaticum]